MIHAYSFQLKWTHSLGTPSAHFLQFLTRFAHSDFCSLFYTAFHQSRQVLRMLLKNTVLAPSKDDFFFFIIIGFGSVCLTVIFRSFSCWEIQPQPIFFNPLIQERSFFLKIWRCVPIHPLFNTNQLSLFPLQKCNLNFLSIHVSPQ